MKRYDKNLVAAINSLNAAKHLDETRARCCRLATLQAYRTMKERPPVEDVKKDWAQFNSDFHAYLQARIVYQHRVRSLRTEPKFQAPLPG